MTFFEIECTTCGWLTTTPTYSMATATARQHGDDCPDASTEIREQHQ